MTIAVVLHVLVELLLVVRVPLRPHRYIRWNFDEGTSFGKEIDNLYLSGPMAGVKFQF